MTYRARPDADRARHQIERHAKPMRHPSALETRLAGQAATALAALSPLAASARMSTPKLVVAFGAALEPEFARSAPGVLALWKLAHPDSPLSRRPTPRPRATLAAQVAQRSELFGE